MNVLLVKLNNFIKSTKGLHWLHKIGKIVYFSGYKNSVFWTMSYLRRRGLGEKEYIQLKKFKNIHEGRCFIIATGPSLTIEDLNKLKNEYTFGMNSICKVFPETGWETTYYGIQDSHVYKKVNNDIAKMTKSIIFYGSEQFSNFDEVRCIHYKYPQYMLNHVYTFKRLTAGFSTDIFKAVYDGYSITYSLIQIAVYMGFKEIYLIGADNNYSDNKKKQHFIESGHYDPTYKTAGQRMTFAYKAAQNFVESSDVKILNATRGGMLEVFPRVDLDEVLGLKDNK
ncbi:6-hydroxymethylpterin diphosphokinase MptE-like protein [Clostridium sp. DL1XJH146]